MALQTPYFVINQKELDANYKSLITALEKYWPNYIIGYSYKTNALPWLISHFNEMGAYAEVVSEDEYGLSELIGVEKNKIIYNGPIKTKESFKKAILNGCYINIDSKRELEWLKELPIANYKIGIRVNFDIEKYCPNESQCGNEGGRFGFCYENGELKNAIETIKNIGFNISGLHLHTSSKTRSLNIYAAIGEVACKIKDELRLDLNFIDIGGGFFGGLKDKPKFDDYLSLVSKIISRSYSTNETTLIVEPGMSIVGAYIDYVTSVIDLKQTTYNYFVITDGSRTHIDPLMSKSNYSYCLRTENVFKKKKQVVCGYTCMEHDRLFTIDDGVELSVGDNIIYQKVGAYTMCLSPLFIKYFPNVFVKNEEMKLVRTVWSPVEYIQNSLLEDNCK